VQIQYNTISVLFTVDLAGSTRFHRIFSVEVPGRFPWVDYRCHGRISGVFPCRFCGSTTDVTVEFPGYFRVISLAIMPWKNTPQN